MQFIQQSGSIFSANQHIELKDQLVSAAKTFNLSLPLTIKGRIENEDSGYTGPRFAG
ncbi:hypothetical protein ACO0LF_11500 [Undibacterium sp. Di27W]|uniref:hypothetical protein n=1 Tax=Undibacterium sp. Di27W TaxID=3413036 RepID=UPI003BF3EB9B